jgi:Protein of unknown function DUF2617
MTAVLTRPRVADLVFQLYGRPLHPELFDILAVRKTEREGYQLRIWITRTGHVITFENDEVLLTEVADADQSFSDQRRFLRYHMRGEHCGRFQCCNDIVYQTSFQVETLRDHLFLQMHEELRADGHKRGILHTFAPRHRFAVPPLGYVVVETRMQCLFFSTFHTFPEEHTIIKSQTLIERQPIQKTSK